MTTPTTTQIDLPRIAMISTHGYVAATPPFGAADTGGQVAYVLELSRKLAQFGYAVDIWTRRFEQQEALEYVADNVQIIRVPCGSSEFIPKEYLHRETPEWVGNALSYIEDHGIVYEFINSHYWDAGVAGEQLASVLGVPHVHTPHSLGIWKLRQMEQDFPESQSSFEQKYNFSERIEHERSIYQSSSLVIATTPAQVDMLREDYAIPVERIAIIPPGYDDTRFYPVGEPMRDVIRARLGFSGTVILALGRLALNKGYDLLVRAFAVAAARVDDAVLYLAVGGTETTPQEERMLEELRVLANSLGIADRIHIAGFIPDEDLADYYRAADLFVLSSRYEPVGMTAIEAMACGTPTVVTMHGGLWQALTYGRHALFADPFDAEDLGITMLKPLRYTRLRARMSRMSASRTRELFTWTGIAQQFLSAVGQGISSMASLTDGEDDWAEPWGISG
ncbi:MAG: glycosyltransferase [Bacteroidetes bacterium]|nr:glycosyltransferase [Bacteroidota bacterium]